MKTHPKKDDRRDQKKINKRAFLRPKLLPKWSPEASGNVCGRRSATEGGKNVFLRPPGRQKMKKSSSAGKKSILKGSDAGMARGWRGDDAGTSLAQAPRGGTIIKENQFNNNFKQDLTRRWAAGPANFRHAFSWGGARAKAIVRNSPSENMGRCAF